MSAERFGPQEREPSMTEVMWCRDLKLHEAHTYYALVGGVMRVLECDGVTAVMVSVDASFAADMATIDESDKW